MVLHIHVPKFTCAQIYMCPVVACDGKLFASQSSKSALTSHFKRHHTSGDTTRRMQHMETAYSRQRTLLAGRQRIRPKLSVVISCRGRDNQSKRRIFELAREQH
jgi:hypothetical protein